jgi:hypothetical protein
MRFRLGFLAKKALLLPIRPINNINISKQASMCICMGDIQGFGKLFAKTFASLKFKMRSPES